MRTKKRLLPALLMSLFAAGSADAAQFSGVHVFGDSLSDAGYFRPWLSSIGIPAPLVATLGRFTTNPGPIWSELVTTYYGGTPGASNASGSVYAQGGARVAEPSPLTPPGQAQRPVSTQIGEFLSANGNAADPRALYSVWAGANDIFVNLGQFQAGAITQAQAQANVLGAATAEVQQIGRLAAAGARYILVFGLPDIGATPQFSAADAATRAAVTQLSGGYNSTLFSGLATAGIRVIPIDAFTLLAEIRANPSAYGFTNITGVACGPFPPVSTSGSAQFCYPGNYVAPNAAETYLFADGVHPTTAAHRIVANFVEAMVDAPGTMSLLAEAPLRTRMGHIRTLNDGLMAGQQRGAGSFEAFAAADGADFDIDTGGGNAGQSSTNKSYTVGVTMRASESFTVGLAAGKSKSDASFGQDLGGFRTDETNYSFFGGMRLSGFYLNGALTMSDIDFNDVRRRVKLGPVVRTATSRPQGSNASAVFNGGYDFPIGKFSLGPVVSVVSQNVEVTTFEEAGAGSANLRFGTQKRRSEVWSVGVRASYDWNGWTPYVRVTADKERKDDERLVTATPLSLATANSYALPAYAADSSYVTTYVGLRGRLTPNLGVGVMYFNVSSREGISEDGITGTISYRF